MVHTGARDGAARARARSASCPTRTCGSGPRCSASAALTRRSRRSTKRFAWIPSNGQAHQALARAYWVGKGDFAAAIPVFERAIALNPEAGYSYLQLGAAADVGGPVRRKPRTSAGAPSICRTSSSRATPGCRSSAPTRGSATCTTSEGATTTRMREYEREHGLHRSSSDHALRDRTLIELNVKIGAAYSAPGTAGTRRSALRPGAEDASTRASPRAQTIRSPATTSPACTRSAATPTAPSTRSSAWRRSCRRSPLRARARSRSGVAARTIRGSGAELRRTEHSSRRVLTPASSVTRQCRRRHRRRRALPA